ncbi:MAG: hypothetical protein EAZ14_00720 [Runella slithyformis]|nr:MAG: hypothetical protein EAZ26_05690 [Runella slithyformis]TAH16335.1 MAG: hypothetical protein EAZ14_00720 [Runella slithyformis]
MNTPKIAATSDKPNERTNGNDFISCKFCFVDKVFYEIHHINAKTCLCRLKTKAEPPKNRSETAQNKSQLTKV